MKSEMNIFPALDLEAAKRWTQELNSYEKNGSFSDFTAAAEYCCRALAEAGFEKIELLPHIADGTTSAFDCTMPPAWELCGRSVLRIADRDIVIADTDENPCAAAPWSAPTPPEGITAKLIAVEPGEKADVKGKWVLLTIRDGLNPQGAFLEELRRGGAVGVAAVDFCSGKDYPQSIRWFNGTGRFGWYPVASDQRLPLFSISAAAAGVLLRELEQREVTLHGVMNTRIETGKLCTVTAVIPGRSEKEYALFSHICEPFAADNAVGFGITCAVGRAIRANSFVPEKTLRVVYTMELYGFAAYLADEERSARIAGALNMDAVNHRKQRLLKFFDSPLCNPWFGDWVLPEILQQYLPDTKFTRSAGTLSDDTFAGDPFCGNLPINWCMNPSESAHHCFCSDFEPDWQWAKEELSAFAAAVTEMLQFSAEKAENFSQLAAEEFRIKSQDICRSSRSFEDKLLLLRELYQYLAGRLVSAEKYCDTLLDKQPLTALYRQTAAAVSGERKALSETAEIAASIIPQRLKAVPFSMAEIPENERKSVRVSRLLYSLFDGKRTLYEAVTAADWLTGKKSSDSDIAAEISWLKYFEKYDYIALK